MNHTRIQNNNFKTIFSHENLESCSDDSDKITKNAEKQNRKIAESGMQETRNMQKNAEIAGTEKNK